MKGKVTCQLIGGPEGDQTLVLPAMSCRDTLALEGESWCQENEEGGVSIVKGDRRNDPKWIWYSLSIYEKQNPVIPGCVTYRFVRREIVDRCEKVLEDKGRRCKNDALPSLHYCRAHKTAP